MFVDDFTKSAGVETKADPFSLDALIAWLRTKDAEGIYCYQSHGDCLIAQYLKEQCSISGVSVGGDYWRDPISRKEVPFPKGWGDVALGAPRTFSAALTRALSIQAGGK